MWWIPLLIVAFLIVSGLVVMLIKTVPISKRVYEDQLVKTEPSKWGRVCSCPENEEQQSMWDEGCLWANARADKKQDVHIINEGLNLYGEYYNFTDKKRCVIILPGRCECLKYSYYFAPAYEESEYNVLVIDSRAHGKSDGKYNTVGVGESRDLIAWVKFVEEKFGIEEIYLHTICVGTASAMIALSSDKCPQSVKGLVTEGCFVSFRETFKQHMIDAKRPLFPVLDLVMLQILFNTKTNVYKTAPIKLVGKIKQRVLFLYGEKDIFSLPQKSKLLFSKCKSEDKQVVWFDKGGHSHLRINNKEKYDNAIKDFLGGKGAL